MAAVAAADGTAIEWHDEGDGPPVVLVHGITENAGSWDPVAGRLAADHRVIRFDLRGHGRSAPAAGGDYGLGAMAGDVGAVLAAAGAEGAHLVGHSLGGAVVSAAAAALPVASATNVDQPLALGEFKAQVVALEAHLRDPEAFPHVMTQVFDSLVGDLLPPAERQRVEALRRPDQEVVLGIWAMLLEQSAQEVAAAVDGALAGFDVPYLSLFGVDPGPDYPGWLTARIPAAEMEVWADHGHYPHLVDPDRFVARLHQFWASLPT